MFFLDVPFEENLLARKAGAVYYRGYGHVYIGKELPAPLKVYAPRRYSWLEWTEHEFAGRHSNLVDAPAPDTTTGTFTLRRDQLQDVKKVLMARRAGAPEVLVGSDMGSGKTAVVVAAVKRMANVRNVLVVCPAPVMPVWRLHLENMGDGGMNWCIINYESTKKLLKVPASVERMKAGRAKNLNTVRDGKARVQWDVVIRDEAHWCANPESQQTRVVDKVIAGPGVRSAWTISMTGTPGENPSRLSYLHRGLFWRSHLKPAKTLTPDQYVAWCERQHLSVDRSGYGNALAWRPEDGADTRELEHTHALLYGGDTPWGFRRIPDWPEQQRIAMPVELSPAETRAYEAEWSEFQAALTATEKAASRAQSIRENPKSTRAQRAAAARANQKARMQGRAAQTRYRQKAGQIRAPGTAAFVAQKVEQGYQVPLSVEFHSTGEAIAEHLEARGVKVATFTGQNRATREEQRVAFQRGEVPVIIYTPAEGLSLHAGEHAVGGNDVPRATVVGEPRWTATKALQKEKRGQRNGTEAPAHYMYASGTIEETMVRRVVGGMQNMARVNGDDLEAILQFEADLDTPDPPGGTT